MNSEGRSDLVKDEHREVIKGNGKIGRLIDENIRLSEENRQLREKNTDLEQLVTHDTVTGLPIRRLFDKRMEELLERLNKGSSEIKLGVCILRLDKNYAKIKNTRDRNHILIFKTASRIKEIIGENVYQSDRLDEFLIFFNGVSDENDLRIIAQKIVDSVSLPHEAPAEDISYSCYLGISLFPSHGLTKEELLGNADIALSESEDRKHPITIYTEQVGKRFRDNLKIEKELMLAIQDGFSQFHIVYQPFLDAQNNVRGSEALIRWTHPELGVIPPSRFINIAEDSGDIRFLGQWVLYHSCKKLKSWHTMGYTDLYISVNLSPSQFKQRDLVKRIAGVLESLELEGRFLKLELTEGTIMEDPEDAIVKMEKLKSLGINISIDDFGTGYSSLNYLKQFPIDTLKIDKSFIDDVESNVNNQEIVKAIISMARNIRIETLAEGVETLDQLTFLLKEGCQNIQGYYFSKPLVENDFTAYLEKWWR